jgi:hypothetical protein
MRKSLITFIAGCASVLVAAALLSAGGAPAGAATSQGRYLFPLAGDSQYLVYSQSHVRYGSKNFTGCSTGSPTLHVRDKAGHTRTLTVAHDGKSYDQYANPCFGMYLNGSMLTMEGISGSRDPIYWWDLERHTRGVVREPQNSTKLVFEGSVPGGWIYAPADYTAKNSGTATTLQRQDATGKVTTLPEFPRFFVGGVATSTRGIATVNDIGRTAAPLYYRVYGNKAEKVLDDPAHTYGYNGCDAVTATYVACHSIRETDENGTYLIYEASITPLNGGPTITNTTAFAPKVGTMLDNDAALALPGGLVALLAPTKTTSALRGFGTGGRVSSSPGHGATAMTVAYGQIAVGHRGGQITLQKSVTSKQHTILP